VVSLAGLSVDLLLRGSNSLAGPGLDFFEQKLVSIERNNWAEHYLKANSAADSGNLTEAVKRLKHLLGIIPRRTLIGSDAHFRRMSLERLADLYVKMDMAGKAIQTLDTLVNESPGSAYGHLIYGCALMKLGKKVAAEDQLRTGLEIAPNDPRIIEALIKLYGDEGRLDDVLKVYERYEGSLSFIGGKNAVKKQICLMKGNDEICSFWLSPVVDGQERTYSVPICSGMARCDGTIDRIRLTFNSYGCQKIDIPRIILRPPKAMFQEYRKPTTILDDFRDASTEGCSLDGNSPTSFEVSGPLISVTKILPQPILAFDIDSVELRLSAHKKQLSVEAIDNVNKARRQAEELLARTGPRK
jgi:tetratricopeptide (TPR) repeat protein